MYSLQILIHQEVYVFPYTSWYLHTPQQDFVNYNKPALQDASIDKQTKAGLDKLLDNNKDAFADDKRQIGTTPLIAMTIDTGDHPSIAKKPYTLALKHYDWVKEEIDKLLEAGVIRKSHSSWSAPIVVVPMVMVGNDFV